LDEEELKRCENVKDYYALYKVFKKSGPGPKNGEQYGAPFKEEDWADEEAPSTNELVVTEKQVHVAPVDDYVQIHAEALPPADDIEEFMKRMLDEPLLPEEDVNIFAEFLQAVGEEDSQITLVEPSSGNAIVPHSNGGQYDEQAGFGFTQMLTSNPQVYETPEVTSATCNWDQAPHVLGEEGFLEIDDLNQELATSPFVEKPVDDGSLQLYDYGDLFHDAEMFLNDIGHIDHGAMSNLYNNGEGNAMLSLQYTNDFTLQADTAVGNQHVWTSDQRNDFTPSPLSQAAGSVRSSEANQINRGEDGADPSWMSSMLWSFVESIPTTPASASESPLVNRAFERMSSFSRFRMNARNNNVFAADNSPPTVKRTTTGGNKKKGFVLLSIIGALLAILWVFFSTVRIMGRVVFS
jgi:hypothetical protein